ncbi:MAG: hypothetical protein MZU97_16275 [Bacillus subtilis]|nr:hypothetical protein [Bacillus subtilis]
MYLHFLGDLEADFIDDVIALQTDYKNEIIFQTELSILLLLEFDAFQTANPTLFAAVENALSEADELVLFNAWKASINDLVAALGADESVATIASDVVMNLTYPMLVAAQAVDQKIADAALAHMIASDFALLRAQAFADSFEYDYWEEIYWNSADDFVYANESSFEFAKTIANIDVMIAALKQAKAIVEATSTADAQTLITLLTALIPQAQLQEMLGINAFQSAALVGAINTALNDETTDMRSFILSLLNYLIDESVLEGLRTVLGANYSYYTTNYGDDYLSNYEHYSDSYGEYAIAIYVAGHIDAFMTAGNVEILKGFVTTAFTIIKRSEVLAGMNLILADVQEIETNLQQMIDDFIAQARIVKNYNPATLTTEQETAIDDWLGIINDSHKQRNRILEVVIKPHSFGNAAFFMGLNSFESRFIVK